MLVVRANCNASDEASVVVDVGKVTPVEPTTAADASQKATSLDENVVMKLSFGACAAVGSHDFECPANNVTGVLSGSGLYSSIAGSDLPVNQQYNAPPPQDWSIPATTAPAYWSSVPNVESYLLDSSKGLTSDAAIPSASAAPKVSSIHPMAKVVRLLAEFEEKGKTGEWPLSTSVHCYWCSHRFDSPPVGLPIKYIPSSSSSGGQGKFQTIGCFCSLQCACAYNFDSNRDSEDECMTRYGLLNALSAKLGCGRIVKPAPSRLALSMYGGHMSIDEFRSYGNGSRLSEGVQRQIIINCPPMQSLTQQVEDIAETDMTSEYRYVPLDNDRVQRYQEKVRLQRTKPLSDMKNTLDRTMKLKYSTNLLSGDEKLHQNL
jgi:hypothetical protein